MGNAHWFGRNTYDCQKKKKNHTKMNERNKRNMKSKCKQDTHKKNIAKMIRSKFSGWKHKIKKKNNKKKEKEGKKKLS